MTKEQMYDLLGQAHTLNLISAEQFNALVDAIDREGWRDIVEFALLELGHHVSSAQLNSMASSPKDHKSYSRVMKLTLTKEEGQVGTFRCKKCGLEHDVTRTMIGQWPLKTWQCPSGCKLR